MKRKRPRAPTIDYRDRPKGRRSLFAVLFAAGALCGLVVAKLTTSSAPPAAETAQTAAEPPVDAKAQAAAAPQPTSSTLTATNPEGRATSEGALAAYRANELANSLQRQSPALKVCYDTYLEDEPDDAEGKVTIDFQIDPDGKVLAPGIVSTELNDRGLSDCLVARVAGFAFPPPPDRRKAYASHTFVFRRGL